VGIAITVIDDGRAAYLAQAIASLSVAFPRMPSDRMILVNDSGDPNYAQELLHTYHHTDRQIHHAHRRGLAGALRSAWEAALETDCEFIFHAEGAFIYGQEIPIGHMADLLDADRNLAQVSLKRQPVNEYEASRGGFIQCAPDSYWQRDGYISHQVCFTFNPCLIPRFVAELCLQNPGAGLEKDFTALLLEHGYSFGIYGTINDPPRCEHIGVTRSQQWSV